MKEDNNINKFQVHLVSDSTGETVHSISRACLVQFEKEHHPEEHLWPMVRNIKRIEEIISSIEKKPGPVFFTILDPDLANYLLMRCKALQVPCVNVLGPILSELEGYLGLKRYATPGLQHALDQEYFKRIAAIQFAVDHDDGQLSDKINEADVILVGVSRTSKSPTCIYLANRGIKAANVPYVPGISLPKKLFELKNKLIIGLICDPKRLVEIRQQRLSHIDETQMRSSYVDYEEVLKEVTQAKRIFAQNKWPLIDVSRRSIEETAAEIMKRIYK